MGEISMLVTSLKPVVVSAVTDNGGLKGFIEGMEMQYQHDVCAKHWMHVVRFLCLIMQ